MQCIVCKSSKKKSVFKNLTQCENCKLLYYNNNKIDTKKLYDENYFKGEEYFDYEKDKDILQKNFSCRLRDIKKYISRGNLFEIGCAYGFFLDLAKKDFHVSGIDITEKPTKYASNQLNLKVSTGSYLEHSLDKKVDVVCMWDTIEHLEFPEKFIRKISIDLNPGGYFFLTTGDIGSLLAKSRGSKWRMIHPPTHLFYFSNKTITRLLENYGFEVLEVSHPGVYRSLKQIFYSLFFLNKKRAPKSFERAFKKLDIPIYVNTFDIMMVVAKKI